MFEILCSIATSIVRNQKESGLNMMLKKMVISQWVGNEDEVVNQSSIAPYYDEIDFEKDSIEKSAEYDVAFENFPHMVRNANMKTFEYYEPKQRIVLD